MSRQFTSPTELYPEFDKQLLLPDYQSVAY